MMTSRKLAIVTVTAGIVLSGCGQEHVVPKIECEILANPPAPSEAAIENANCPGSTPVHLSAVFKGGKPVGVGGGTDAGTRSKSDKKVKGGQNICWVATDESGGPSDQHFDILFSPSDKPTLNRNYKSVNIFPRAPVGLQYKYTVWVNEEKCMYFDPRFFID